ncbi:MAG: hypothetical protein J2P47_05700 [Acetobacteraceae bacterium]|nr:hypothetical protein [Acetobacteraceae bacterium]
MISRNWQCLNKRCGAVFHSYAHSNPPCPHCGCVRVSWVPGGGHVGRSAAIDATLRSLADGYRMSDINSASPSRLNRSMPKHGPQPVADGPIMNFAPGFAAPFNTGGMATCEPSHQRLNFTAKVAAGSRMSPSRSYPQIGRDHLGLPGLTPGRAAAARGVNWKRFG